MSPALKALIHVQHLLGTGHAVRAVAIGRALAQQGVRVVLATGNTLPPTLDTGGLEVVALPAARAADTGFTRLVTATGAPVDAAWQAERRARLLGLAAALAPDILVTETWPFGRKPFAFELKPLVAAVRAQTPAAVVAASVRDILVRKDDPAKEQAMALLARADFDCVLVHADPAFVRLEDSFGFAADIADLIAYTGFVHTPSPLEPPGRDGCDEVIVSCGGGPVGQRLIAAALAARPLSRRAGDAPWRVLVGHQHGADRLAALQAAAPPGVTVETARPDFARLLARARLSVSQAGYNTVLDVLAAGTRAVLVPFAEGRETEQAQRADLLAARGRAVVLAEAGVDAARLAAAADAALAAPAVATPVNTDGAATSAALLIERARRKRG
ncbi:glycosyltransferase [Pseudoxanthobacter sp.]|uniref:glycosyltransferase family protein n=1 Tax=Pseudoxanthobacter sp. TaxID=1925742 RepID=UPI002FE0E961